MRVMKHPDRMGLISSGDGLGGRKQVVVAFQFEACLPELSRSLHSTLNGVQHENKNPLLRYINRDARVMAAGARPPYTRGQNLIISNQRPLGQHYFIWLGLERRMPGGGNAD